MALFNTNWMQQRADIIKAVAVASAGGVLNYLYLVATKGKKFKWFHFFLSLGISAFTGYLVGGCLGESVAYRDAFVGISGVLAFQIWDLVNSEGIPVLRAWIHNKFNLTD